MSPTTSMTDTSSIGLKPKTRLDTLVEYLEALEVDLEGHRLDPGWIPANSPPTMSRYHRMADEEQTMTKMRIEIPPGILGRIRWARAAIETQRYQEMPKSNLDHLLSQLEPLEREILTRADNTDWIPDEDPYILTRLAHINDRAKMIAAAKQEMPLLVYERILTVRSKLTAMSDRTRKARKVQETATKEAQTGVDRAARVRNVNEQISNTTQLGMMLDEVELLTRNVMESPQGTPVSQLIAQALQVMKNIDVLVAHMKRFDQDVPADLALRLRNVRSIRLPVPTPHDTVSGPDLVSQLCRLLDDAEGQLATFVEDTKGRETIVQALVRQAGETVHRLTQCRIMAPEHLMVRLRKLRLFLDGRSDQPHDRKEPMLGSATYRNAGSVPRQRLTALLIRDIPDLEKGPSFMDDLIGRAGMRTFCEQLDADAAYYGVDRSAPKDKKDMTGRDLRRLSSCIAVWAMGPKAVSREDEGLLILYILLVACRCKWLPLHVDSPAAFFWWNSRTGRGLEANMPLGNIKEDTIAALTDWMVDEDLIWEPAPMPVPGP